MEGKSELRRALGSYATGVVIVSAARADGAVSGITVNSFASVSLEPPLVLWCLGDQSERYDLFSTAELWGVSVLGAHEEALAHRFARAESEGIAAAELDEFAGAPVLKAGIAHFACRTAERRQAGDHLVLIGHVLDFRATQAPALTFFHGCYGRTPDRA